MYAADSLWLDAGHKVFLQLEEKQIPYTIEKINMRCYGDKPREFTAKVRPARCSTGVRTAPRTDVTLPLAGGQPLFTSLQMSHRRCQTP